MPADEQAVQPWQSGGGRADWLLREGLAIVRLGRTHPAHEQQRKAEEEASGHREPRTDANKEWYKTTSSRSGPR